MISLKLWICLFDAWNNNNYSLPNAGSEKNGDSSFFIRDRFRNKQKKHQKKKKTNPRHWKSLKYRTFWTFWSLYTFCLKQTKHRRKNLAFCCSVLHDAWELQVALDRQKSCVSLQGWSGKKYISKLNVCPWTPRTYGEMKVLHTKIWVK